MEKKKGSIALPKSPRIDHFPAYLIDEIEKGLTIFLKNGSYLKESVCFVLFLVHGIPGSTPVKK